VRGRTTVETEVRFAWSANRKADAKRGDCSRRGTIPTLLRKSSADLSMVSPTMHLAGDLCQAGMVKRGWDEFEVDSQEQPAVYGLDADCPRVACA
jgi:hypothetical protein